MRDIIRILPDIIMILPTLNAIIRGDFTLAERHFPAA
jgi:hypothetical protein